MIYRIVRNRVNIELVLVSFKVLPLMSVSIFGYTWERGNYVISR